MDLKGAAIRSFYNLTQDMTTNENQNSSKTIKIPHYQRPYKWHDENIVKLIQDWSNESGSKYFSGSIVTVAKPEEHELIDGQQRYTTIFLANFIKFLLSRFSIQKSITVTTNIINAPAIVPGYIKSRDYLFKSNDTNNLEETINEQISEIFSNLNTPNAEEHISSLLRQIGLPAVDEDSENYKNEHKMKQEQLFQENELSIKYDRSSFNDHLIDVLSQCRIVMGQNNNLEIELYHDIGSLDSEHKKKYAQAILCIFDEFNRLALAEGEAQNSFQKARRIINKIDAFLDQISLCVIQTGSANDAYTLFEVLNDRSLALDDLDLIKNQFYKKYVTSNYEVLSENEIDKYIQRMDELWVDKIFRNAADSKRKLIAYLAIVYITGDSSLLFNRGEGYRRSIQRHLENKDNYSTEDFERHFNIFYIVRVLLDETDARFKSRDSHALTAEFDTSATNFKKTTLFLLALGQEGVLSGLFNFTLKCIEESVGVNPRHEGINSIAFLLSKNDRTNPGNNYNEMLTKIESQSKHVWSSAMLHSSAEGPRNFSVNMINHFNSTSAAGTAPMTFDSAEPTEEFKAWLSDWKYKNKNAHLKIKILFAKLIKSHLNDDGHLNTATIALNINNASKLQLDHMEASNPDPHHMSAYFTDEDRDSFVHSLGNMMPLPDSENRDKNNKPLCFSFEHFREAGISQGHFLYDEALSIFDNNSKENTQGDRVPVQSFFQQRKSRLIELFVMAVRIN
ncbi:Protein of unknown function [Marinospirillum celere]|uniref:DUF262 domain-containing protein n=1 Tax=Marinospirillum celere TaxID=1122252 RepID=A0A1I1EKG0_9GAMM|nr:DUF262 domain-containing protein [Marinospirillum celere]SFB87126.1 Protein of unknown function [Marinospirillum celere]